MAPIMGKSDSNVSIHSNSVLMPVATNAAAYGAIEDATFGDYPPENQIADQYLTTFETFGQGHLYRTKFAGQSFQVLSMAILGTHLLIGCKNGLFQMDKNGNVVKVVGGTSFEQLHVLKECEVLIALCHGVIRMYNLSTLVKSAANYGWGHLPAKKIDKKKDSIPFTEVKGSKGCTHFAISFVDEEIFLVAAVKSSIMMYSWADQPYDNFMFVQEFYVPEKALKVTPVLAKDENGIVHLYQLCVQTKSLSHGFIVITVNNAAVNVLDFFPPKKSVPKDLLRLSSSQLLICYSTVGFLFNLSNNQTSGITIHWDMPLNSVVVANGQIYALGNNTIKQFSPETGELVATISLPFKTKTGKCLGNFGNDVIFGFRSKTAGSHVVVLRNKTEKC